MAAKAERENIIAERYRMRCVDCRSLGVRRMTVEAAQRDADRHNRKHHKEERD